MKRILVVLLCVAGYAFAADQAPRGLTRRQVQELIVNAKTPADHMKLADHFRKEAERLEAESKEHAALAEGYRRNPGVSEVKRPGSPDTFSHCDHLARQLAAAAQDARALAADHEQMAKK